MPCHLSRISRITVPTSFLSIHEVSDIILTGLGSLVDDIVGIVGKP